MFAIAVDLLAGRYTAMRFNDRTEPEWPPHPARLFFAMVATWADSDAPDPVEREALEWLERQAPPEISCGEEHRRTVVTHFVPVNDSTALTRDVSRNYALMADARMTLRAAEESVDEKARNRAQATFAKAKAKALADAARVGRPTGQESSTVIDAVLAVLPEQRGKQGRTYPTVVPDHEMVWLVWPSSTPNDEHHRALDDVLARVARLGHSSTLVACRCVSSAPQATWTPSLDGSEIRLRVPRAGLVSRLERECAAHQGSEPRTLPAGMIGYRRAHKPRTRSKTPILGGDWYILGITGRRPPSAVQVLAVARATRNAMMAHGDQPPPELISGHKQSPVGGKQPTPPLDRPHLAVVPLPSVGNQHSDGAVFGIALVLPSDASDGDRLSVRRALSAWSEAGFELMLPSGPDGQPIRLTLADHGFERATDNQPTWLDTTLPNRRLTTTRAYWCRPARRWLTATPIALDRFPGNLRSPNPTVRERAEAEAASSVARACVFGGLVDEPEQVHCTIRLDSPLAGVPAAPSGSRGSRSRRYPTYQVGGGTPRACVHADIEFDRPVYGPVLIGAGRYFGYGLCLPADGRPGDS